jgi:hypothetical protein
VVNEDHSEFKPTGRKQPGVWRRQGREREENKMMMVNESEYLRGIRMIGGLLAAVCGLESKWNAI